MKDLRTVEYERIRDKLVKRGVPENVAHVIAVDGTRDIGDASGPRAQASPEAPAGLRHAVSPAIAHTAGPWRIWANDKGAFEIAGAAEYPTSSLMVLAARNNWPGRAKESHANGCLMAAAPDMLSALKMVAGLDIHHSVLAVVDAAIAKAEGR